MTTTLANILLEGKHSLVVDCGEIRTFDGAGIADLYALLHDEPELLRGAAVADKVVGKAAAALMIMGGVGEVYADTVSVPAAELLRSAGVKLSFGREVPHIMNRTATDWCPMEAACRDLPTAEEVYEKIRLMRESRKRM